MKNDDAFVGYLTWDKLQPSPTHQIRGRFRLS
jgi:hypothetical protein